jgi:hypothetical protein
MAILGAGSASVNFFLSPARLVHDEACLLQGFVPSNDAQDPASGTMLRPCRNAA